MCEAQTKHGSGRRNVEGEVHVFRVRARFVGFIPSIGTHHEIDDRFESNVDVALNTAPSEPQIRERRGAR